MKEKNQTKPSAPRNIPELEIIDLDHTPINDMEAPADAPDTDVLPNGTDTSYSSSGPVHQAPPAADTEEELYEDAEEEEEEEENTNPNSRFHFLIHIGFLLLIVLIILLAVHRIRNFGNKVDLDEYEGNIDAEVLDYMVPLFRTEDTQIVDDGKTTLVLFGNSPFADDRDSEDGLASIIAKKTGATVYNCSVADSYLAAQQHTLNPDAGVIDAFSFYWLTTAFCLGDINDYLYGWIFDDSGEQAPADAQPSYELMKSIDYSTVDAIVLMYDGTDYLMGHGMYNDLNDTDIQTFTGNMTAGIDLIQQTYPHIRIIVLSPTYAFAINEDGEYVSSDQYRYNDQDVLSTYVIKQRDYCYDRGVTFVDNLYGTITEDTATQYLTDNLHLNQAGREKVADRLVYALNYFNKE